MATDEPTGRSAAQGDKDASGAPKKRRRRRRPKRKPGASSGGARTAAQPKTESAKRTGSKGAPAGESAGSAAKRTRRKRGGKKRGGAKRASTGKAKTGAGRQHARRPKIPTTREVSAGGVVYRRADDGIEVVLASRRMRR